VTASSGSPALDAQTCRLIWLRARFTPARDASGAPVTSTYQQRLVWRIGVGDDDAASSQAWTDRWVVSESANGLPLCRSELRDILENENARSAPCPPYVAGVATSLFDGPNSYSNIVVEQRFSVDVAPTIVLAPTDQFVGRELARLDIDSAGTVSSCKVLETVGFLPPQLSRACLIAAKRYVPRKNAGGSPAPFTAYSMIGIYAHSRK
jgi:hypothetical protein